MPTRAEDSSSTSAPSKPKTRQRVHKEPPALAVPNINDDATERKRVLNVLAQRRYRERRRQTKRQVRSPSDVVPALDDTETAISSSTEVDAAQTNIAAQIFDDSISLTQPLADACPSLDPSVQLPWSPGPAESVISGLLSGVEKDLVEFDSITSSGNLTTTSLIIGNNNSGTSLPMETVRDADASLQNISGRMDTSPQALLDGSSSNTTESGPGGLKDSSYYEEDSLLDLTSFPDSYLLPMNELTLMRAFLRIASRLRCTTECLWDADAHSPFLNGTLTASTVQQLPCNWRPTATQFSIPHHPVVDFLPWPGVRHRVLLILSLPDELRPPGARGDLALINFVYDLENSAEGIRIWGGDPYDPTAWEVGQILFERWWFVFDRQVVEQSNYWRKMRGAATLMTKSTPAEVSEPAPMG